MKIRIDRNGVFSGPKAEPVPVGAVMRVPDSFKGFPGKCSPVPDNTPVTFPAPETKNESVDVTETDGEQVTVETDDEQPPTWGNESAPEPDDEEALRARYEVVFGKKPHGNATAKSMREAIAKEMGE